MTFGASGGDRVLEASDIDILDIFLARSDGRAPEWRDATGALLLDATGHTDSPTGRGASARA